MFKIDKKSYKISDNNFVKEENKKKQIILAESLRKDHNHILRLQKKEFGKSKAWPTFTISREGEIYQHFDPKHYSDFMGIPDIDKQSISIVLENMGALFYNYHLDRYYNWCNEECSDKFVFKKEWKEYSYWEKHNENQTLALVDLCKFLCEKYNIELDCVGFNFFTVETIDFYGIVCRGNYSYDFHDPNPAFNFKYFLENLGIIF